MNRMGKLFVGALGGLFVLVGLGTPTPKVDAAVTTPNPSIERVTAQTPLYLTTAANSSGVGIAQGTFPLLTCFPRIPLLSRISLFASFWLVARTRRRLKQ